VSGHQNEVKRHRPCVRERRERPPAESGEHLARSRPAKPRPLLTAPAPRGRTPPRPRLRAPGRRPNDVGSMRDGRPRARARPRERRRHAARPAAAGA
jgi:hypothetical protein